MVLAVRMTEPCEGCFTYRRQEPEFLCFGVLIILFLLCLSRLSLTELIYLDSYQFISSPEASKADWGTRWELETKDSSLGAHRFASCSQQRNLKLGVSDLQDCHQP